MCGVFHISVGRLDTLNLPRFLPFKCDFSPIFQLSLSQSECKAIVDLANRSSPTVLNRLVSECFHTNGALFKTNQSNDSDKTEGKKDEKKGGDGSQQDGNKKNDEKEDENDQKPLLPFLTKVVVYTATVYAFAIVLSLFLFPNAPEKDEQSRVVSWNEFVHHMLSKGEVRELVIKPKGDFIVVFLHKGAVVKGRRLNSKYCILSANTDRFEERLRDVEAKLGLTEGKCIKKSQLGLV